MLGLLFAIQLMLCVIELRTYAIRRVVVVVGMQGKQKFEAFEAQWI